jgi:hypothetical protein
MTCWDSGPRCATNDALSGLAEEQGEVAAECNASRPRDRLTDRRSETSASDKTQAEQRCGGWNGREHKSSTYVHTRKYLTYMYVSTSRYVSIVRPAIPVATHRAKGPKSRQTPARLETCD